MVTTAGNLIMPQRIVTQHKIPCLNKTKDSLCSYTLGRREQEDTYKQQQEKGM